MWKNDNNALTTRLQFKDFNECFEFMTQVAAYAEKEDHHPTWTNTYNNLDILLTTHDTGGVSNKDHKMATFITDLFDQFR